MNDKSIELINKSWLMLCTGNYEKTMVFLKEAKSILNSSDISISLEDKSIRNEYISTLNSQNSESKKFKEKDVGLDKLIEKQMRKIYKISNEAQDNYKKNAAILNFAHSEDVACIFDNTDYLQYKCRLSPIYEFNWCNEKNATDIKKSNCYIECLSYSSQLVTFKVENEYISGHVYFSSLGISEGVVSISLCNS